MAYPLFSSLFPFISTACLQVKNKLRLAVLSLDGRWEVVCGLGGEVGLYQAGDASQGLFLILQAMRVNGVAGYGTALFCRDFLWSRWICGRVRRDGNCQA